MDRITSGFLKEFSLSRNLNTLEETIQFEHFSNFCALSSETSSSDIDIIDMHTGKDTQGIDGIAIEVNGKIVTSANEIQSLIQINNKLDVKFILVQAKTSPSFENSLISNFLTFAYSFFSEEAAKVFFSDEMANFIEMKDYIYNNSSKMKSHNPKLILYYVSLGKWYESDISLMTVVSNHKDSLNKTNLFSEVKFIPCGVEDILRMYRKSNQQIESTFVFTKNTMMFSEDKGDYAFIGVLPFSEYLNIICDDNELLKPVFEDNIRDFLGETTSVNSDILSSVVNGKKSDFCMLNNGVTVVSDSAVLVSDKMTITNYQIVNGCQTSHVLYQNRNAEGVRNILIPVKIIVTANEDLKSRITKATNYQTSIKKEQLEALSTFQRTLEEYYRTFNELYYERRSGQYRKDNIPISKVVTIRAQIKSASSMFSDRPHDAAGHYNSLLSDIGRKIFVNDDKPILYYISSLALFRFESLIKLKQIDRKYGKGKYQIIMLLKVMLFGDNNHRHNSKKFASECEKILKVLSNESEYYQAFKKITDYVDENKELDLADRKLFERKETTDILLKNKEKLLAKR